MKNAERRPQPAARSTINLYRCNLVGLKENTRGIFDSRPLCQLATIQAYSGTIAGGNHNDASKGYPEPKGRAELMFCTAAFMLGV